MKFNDETKPLYIEMDASIVGLEVMLLQTRNNTSCAKDEAPDLSIFRPIVFASKSEAVKRYSNIEREALGILYGIEKVHHYCFAREVSIITDHKPLVTIFKKDSAVFSHRLQQILLRLYQYRVRIIYQPGPDLFIVDWLSTQNHNKDKGAEIPGMQFGISAIQTTTNIPECMTIHELQQVTCQDQHMQCLKEYIIQSWPEHKDQVQDIRPYCTFKDNMAVIDGGHPERKVYSSVGSITTTGTPTATYQSHGH